MLAEELLGRYLLRVRTVDLVDVTGSTFSSVFKKGVLPAVVLQKLLSGVTTCALESFGVFIPLVSLTPGAPCLGLTDTARSLSS